MDAFFSFLLWGLLAGGAGVAAWRWGGPWATRLAPGLVRRLTTLCRPARRPLRFVRPLAPPEDAA